jgi:hypothetical protein
MPSALYVLDEAHIAKVKDVARHMSETYGVKVSASGALRAIIEDFSLSAWAPKKPKLLSSPKSLTDTADATK